MKFHAYGNYIIAKPAPSPSPPSDMGAGSFDVVDAGDGVIAPGTRIVALVSTEIGDGMVAIHADHIIATLEIEP